MLNDVISDLGSAAKERLQTENNRICLANEELAQKEKQYFETYQTDKDTALSTKKKELDDIAEKIEQLKVDRVYIDDCEQSCNRTSENIDSLSASEREQLQRETIAIEIEQERIEEEEKELTHRESIVQSNFESALQDLEIRRSNDIDSLNKERVKVKEMKDDWVEVVDQEIVKNMEKRSNTMLTFEEKEKNRNKTTEQSHQLQLFEIDKQQLLEERNALEIEQLCQSNDARKSIATINGKSAELDEKTKREIDKISTRMKT